MGWRDRNRTLCQTILLQAHSTRLPLPLPPPQSTNLHTPTRPTFWPKPTMTLPLTELLRITDFAGWGATGTLVACGRGSEDIVEIRRVRSWVRRGCHGLSIPWTSLKNIAEFSGFRASALLCQSGRGSDMMKLLRRVTHEAIIYSHYAAIAQRTAEIDRQERQRREERQLQVAQPAPGPQPPQRQRIPYDTNDPEILRWRNYGVFSWVNQL